jgi:uncharacterized protein YbaP (TraB family)
MKRFIPTLILAALAVLSTPASAQEGPLAPVPVATQTIKDIDPALWVVSDSDTTIYLFGTVHILKPGLGWFDDGVKTAFDASDTLVLEMIEPSAAEVGQIMADLSIDKSGKKLRDKLTAEDRVVYEAALPKVGLTPEVLDPLDPWAAAVNIYFAGLMRNGYDLTSGVETQLNAAAKAKNKQIIGLETMRGQLSIFDQLPADIQIRYVVDTVKALDQIVPQTDRLVELWSAADTDGVATIMNEGFDQLQLTEPLLTKRNANWARWINQRMAKPGIVFMAVGAGHLAGPTSVQVLLQAYGLTSSRVVY